MRNCSMIITLRNHPIPSPQFRTCYALVKLEDGSQEEKNNILPYVYGSYKSKRRGSSNRADNRFSIAIPPLLFFFF